MRWVGVCRAAGVCLLLAAIASHLPASADGRSTNETAPAKVSMLDVPFVPQGPALCGGAALAMVLRYWGHPAVLAEDFAGWIEPRGTGIRSDDLVTAVRARGWTAYPVTGTLSALEEDLARGRPIVVLLRTDS